MICMCEHIFHPYTLYIYIQGNEVNGSNNMEKEGLVMAVKKLQEYGLAIGNLITDRHFQIAKWVREELPSTTHHYDVWHLAKSILSKWHLLS